VPRELAHHTSLAVAAIQARSCIWIVGKRRKHPGAPNRQGRVQVRRQLDMVSAGAPRPSSICTPYRGRRSKPAISIHIWSNPAEVHRTFDRWISQERAKFPIFRNQGSCETNHRHRIVTSNLICQSPVFRRTEWCQSSDESPVSFLPRSRSRPGPRTQNHTEHIDGV